jgi:hypothetical protein
MEWDSVDQKKNSRRNNQKSNKGFVITTDVTSTTYYSSNQFTQMSLNIMYYLLQTLFIIDPDSHF